MRENYLRKDSSYGGGFQDKELAKCVKKCARTTGGKTPSKKECGAKRHLKKSAGLLAPWDNSTL